MASEEGKTKFKTNTIYKYGYYGITPISIIENASVIKMFDIYKSIIFCVSSRVVRKVFIGSRITNSSQRSSGFLKPSNTIGTVSLYIIYSLFTSLTFLDISYSQSTISSHRMK